MALLSNDRQPRPASDLLQNAAYLGAANMMCNQTPNANLVEYVIKLARSKRLVLVLNNSDIINISNDIFKFVVRCTCDSILLETLRV